MTIVLGVDLGTTWTAAAVRHDARIEALTLGTHTSAIPSLLAVDEEASVVAGERAERRWLAEPSKGVRDAKRRMGDTTPIVLGGTPYGAEALLGHLLGHVVEVATEREGTPGDIVLTHPATWGDYKLDLLREAARIAGHDDVVLLTEPVAAALHYVRLGRIGPGDAVAVYDFGGGTFDATVVRCTEEGAEILGKPEGLERLGGIDLDQIVVAHVDAALDGALRSVDTTDPDVRRGIAALRASCIRAKEALSSEAETTVPVALPSLSTEVRLTRDELEAAMAPRIADTLTTLDRVVASAGSSYEDLAGVLLVGGSSRIPAVGERLTRHTGRPVLVDADPKLVVALGAAGATGETHVAAGADGAGGGERAAIAGAVGAAGVAVGAAAGAGAARAAGRRDAGSQEGQTAARAGRGASGGAGVAAKVRRAREEGGFVTAGAALGGVAATGGAVAAGALGLRALRDDGDEGTEAEDEVDEDAGGLADVFDDVAGPGSGAASPAGFGAGSAMGAMGVGATSSPGTGGAGPAGAPSSGGAAGTVDPAWPDVQRELVARIEGLEPPAGADPEAFAALRADLVELVEAFHPAPGQSIDHALIVMRRLVENEVQNFARDLRLDAVLEEIERLREAERARQEGERQAEREALERDRAHIDERLPVVEDALAQLDAVDRRLEEIERDLDAAMRTLEDERLPSATRERWEERRDELARAREELLADREQREQLREQLERERELLHRAREQIDERLEELGFGTGDERWLREALAHPTAEAMPRDEQLVADPITGDGQGVAFGRVVVDDDPLGIDPELRAALDATPPTPTASPPSDAQSEPVSVPVGGVPGVEDTSGDDTFPTADFDMPEIDTEVDGLGPEPEVEAPDADEHDQVF